MDRKHAPKYHRIPLRRSLSARRAWIEKLLKCQVKKYSGSLSARRAWIENDALTDDVSTGGSLSARRAWIENRREQRVDQREQRRSPQGERG